MASSAQAISTAPPPPPGFVPETQSSAPAPPPGFVPEGQAAQPRTWLDDAKDAAQGIWEKVNPVSGIQGAAQLAAHPIDTYTADAASRTDIINKAEAAFKKGDYASGVAHALNGIIPFLGPQMEEAGENIQQGQVAKGVGQSVGMGLNLSTPALLKGAGAVASKVVPTGAADALSSRLYQSALKPSTTLPTSKVASAVRTGIENEIPVSPEGLDKLNDLMGDLNNKIAAEIGKNPNAPISKYAVASNLAGTMQRFANQVTPISDLDAIRKTGNEFLQNQPNDIPASQAQAMKQGTYQQLSSKAYGELGTATTEAQKALARGLKEELAKQFPELDSLNAADSKLINLSDVLERAVKRISNHQMLGIGTPIAGAAGSAITGSGAAGGAIGLLKSVIDDPFVKSKLAFAIDRASKGQGAGAGGISRIAAYSSALGNVATGANPNVPTSGSQP